MQWPLCTPCYFGFRPCFCPFRHWCLQDIEATKPMHLASWRARLRCGSYPHAHAASSVFFCTFGAHGSEADDDRKSVVSGKSVSVRVDLGGRRILQNRTTESY